MEVDLDPRVHLFVVGASTIKDWDNPSHCMFMGSSSIRLQQLTRCEWDALTCSYHLRLPMLKALSTVPCSSAVKQTCLNSIENKGLLSTKK